MENEDAELEDEAIANVRAEPDESSIIEDNDIDDHLEDAPEQGSIAIVDTNVQSKRGLENDDLIDSDVEELFLKLRVS